MSWRAFEALRRSKVTLLRKHDVITCGTSYEEALDNAVVVEELAKSAISALLLGKPEELTEADIEYVREFKKKVWSAASQAALTCPLHSASASFLGRI